MNIQLFAGELVAIKIYSNDGLTKYYEGMLKNTENIIVNSTGCSYNGNQIYTYSNVGRFLGLSTQPSASVPMYEIGESITFEVSKSIYYVVEEIGTTYEHIKFNNNKVQVDSAIRDGNGLKIDTNYSLKSNTIADVIYDTANKKIQKTKNGTTTDLVTFGSNAFSDVTIPTDTNQLQNSAGFITNTVDNLTNYYTKNETYTQTEINNLLASIDTIEYKVVDSLPTASSTTYFNDSKLIYMVAISSGSGTDYYNEYITIRSGNIGSYTYSWEKIGNTQVDLSGYVKKDGANAQQTISLTSGSGTTAFGVKSAAASSYISFSSSSGWLASIGITSAKKPTVYDGTSHDIAYTSDIKNATITITQGGVSKGSFTLNQDSAQTIALDAVDVQVNGTSIISSGIANIVTNTAYNASSNKIATMSDLPNIISTQVQITETDS